MKSKLLLIYIISTFFFVIPFSVLAVTDEEIQARCWTESQCNDYKGIWGKSAVYRSNQAYGNGKNDAWSIANCRDIGEKPTARCFAGHPNLPLQVGIPGVTTGICSETNSNGEYVSCSKIGEKCGKAGICRPGIEGGFPGYIAKFYKFFVAALAVVAVVMVMWGGFKRIMAAGSPERVKDANSTITGAITGLVIAILSYSLLNLVNPQLVANTLPLIEKVKPDFFGFCPSYNDNKDLYDAGWYKLSGQCDGGSRNLLVCNSDQDCDSGKCNITETNKVYFDNPLDVLPGGNSCGHKLLVNNRSCIALGCSGSNYGCFTVPGTDPIRRQCAQFFMQGGLSGNKEADLMAMKGICSNGTAYGCYISGPLDTNYASEYNSEGRSNYALSQCFRKNGNEWILPNWQLLCGSQGLKGFVLLTEIDCGGGLLGISCSDDWYAIDSTTCNSPQARPIKTGDVTDPDDINWSQVPANKLLGTGSIATPSVCNLNLTAEQFPNRRW